MMGDGATQVLGHETRGKEENVLLDNIFASIRQGFEILSEFEWHLTLFHTAHPRSIVAERRSNCVILASRTRSETRRNNGIGELKGEYSQGLA